MKKRLMRGKDWHAWAFYEPGKDGVGMCLWAENDKPCAFRACPERLLAEEQAMTHNGSVE